MELDSQFETAPHRGSQETDIFYTRSARGFTLRSPSNAALNLSSIYISVTHFLVLLGRKVTLDGAFAVIYSDRLLQLVALIHSHNILYRFYRWNQTLRCVTNTVCNLTVKARCKAKDEDRKYDMKSFRCFNEKSERSRNDWCSVKPSVTVRLA